MSRGRGGRFAVAAAAAALCSACSHQSTGLGNFGANEVAGVKTTGIYGVEKEPNGKTFRWTNGHAVLVLPPVQSRPQTLAVTVDAFQPTTLTVVVGGRRVLQQALPTGPWSGQADVRSVDFAEPQTIEVNSGTWVPPKANGETRTLGVELIDLELK